MKKRNLRLILNKDGHDTINYKISLPKSWIDKMNLKENDRDVVVSFDNNKIIIEKGECKMFKVIEFYDVYRKDLLDKYGAEEYYYHQANCNTTTETILENFKTEKEAIIYAKERYEKMSQNEKYSIFGNDIYLLRIDVLDCEDDDSIEDISSFGLSLTDFEKISKH